MKEWITSAPSSTSDSMVLFKSLLDLIIASTERNDSKIVFIFDHIVITQSIHNKLAIFIKGNTRGTANPKKYVCYSRSLQDALVFDGFYECLVLVLMVNGRPEECRHNSNQNL
ncbi:hypothetical protein BCV71DRAFT_238196 [Rhizopus microsporus]|uniref:Uncharacterized protein n=1 Tax=Rhizopus microsporus TaxID=58291 RepID=A0A1X0RS19_RHIZD|nr:hypothetical protein BCV71DRAFT_238196 [Rhizopus microsporus]